MSKARAAFLYATILAAGALGTPLLAAEPESVEEAAGLGDEVQAELDRLRRMQEELVALESAPLPSRTPDAEEARQPTDPTPVPKLTAADIPAKPAPGAEEEYANMLFALGEYERAMPVYRQIADATTDPEDLGWALVQLGNCARRSGKHVEALAAYAKALAKAQDTPWAAEASWWTAEVKWRLLWNEEAILNLNVPKVPERSAPIPADSKRSDPLAAR